MGVSRKRTSIHITWHPERGKYQVRFEATEDTFHQVVKALKKIEFEYRSYNSVHRVWSFHPTQLDVLRQIAVQYFDDAQLTEGNKTTNLHTGRVAEQLTLFA